MLGLQVLQGQLIRRHRAAIWYSFSRPASTYQLGTGRQVATTHGDSREPGQCRWEFLLTAAPLAVWGGTGSQINPIATFWVRREDGGRD